ncbi:type II toxin-antitoxin system RelE family toxin [Salinicoccus sp. Marseille-QA3877]
MKYKLKIEKKALKKLKKMDKNRSALLISWINKNLVDTDDPRKHGKALSGDYRGLWRYRVGDYRIVAMIKDDEILISIINLGHKKDVYK